MNLGTAKKWAQRLNECQDRFDFGQLGYIKGGERHLCPIGVLADFLDPSAWSVAWDGTSLLWKGQQFYLSKEYMKKCKMKTDGVWLFEDCYSFKHAAKLVMDRYEEI